MSELLFRETTIFGWPISFAIDIEPALLLGASTQSQCGWYELTLYFGPLSVSFTKYRRQV